MTASFLAFGKSSFHGENPGFELRQLLANVSQRIWRQMVWLLDMAAHCFDHFPQFSDQVVRFISSTTTDVDFDQLT